MNSRCRQKFVQTNVLWLEALKEKLSVHRGAKKSLKTKIVFSFLSGRTEVKIHTF